MSGHEQTVPALPALDQLRADTPGCAAGVYLDAAGSALPIAAVTEAQISHLRREAQIGGYAAAAEAADRLELAKAAAGELVGVPGEQIAWQPNATSGFTRAVSSVPLRAGDRILTTSAEYASNVLPMLQLARRAGATVEFLPDGADGAVDLDALAASLDDRVRIVATTHAPSQNGLICDAAGIGRLLRESGSEAWYVLDACQSAGQLPLDLPGIGCDFLAATGRKFLRGPRGTGFLAVSRRVLAELEPVPIDMLGSTWLGGRDYVWSATAARFQQFETSYAGLAGFGVALRYALDLGVPAISERIRSLAARLRELLAQLPGVAVHDRGSTRGGIVTFTIAGLDGPEACTALRSRGITVVPSERQTNPDDFDAHGITSMLRASPHVYTTPDELRLLTEAVADLTRSR